jgi:hypothetical protein
MAEDQEKAREGRPGQLEGTRDLPESEFDQAAQPTRPPEERGADAQPGGGDVTTPQDLEEGRDPG